MSYEEPLDQRWTHSRVSKYNNKLEFTNFCICALINHATKSLNLAFALPLAVFSVLTLPGPQI